MSDREVGTHRFVCTDERAGIPASPRVLFRRFVSCAIYNEWEIVCVVSEEPFEDPQRVSGSRAGAEAIRRNTHGS